MSNSLVYPIILGRAAGLSPDQLLNLVSLAMLGLGMATFCSVPEAGSSGAAISARPATRRSFWARRCLPCSREACR